MSRNSKRTGHASACTSGDIAWQCDGWEGAPGLLMDSLLLRAASGLPHPTQCHGCLLSGWAPSLAHSGPPADKKFFIRNATYERCFSGDMPQLLRSGLRLCLADRTAVCRVHAVVHVVALLGCEFTEMFTSVLNWSPHDTCQWQKAFVLTAASLGASLCFAEVTLCLQCCTCPLLKMLHDQSSPQPCTTLSLGATGKYNSHGTAQLLAYVW